MANLNYIVGDATSPIGEGAKVIPHVCNDIGAWGSGFVVAVSRKWREPVQVYRDTLNRIPESDRLGTVSFSNVGDGIVVANMVAQRDIKWKNGVAPIRYNALDTAMQSVGAFAIGAKASIHCPRFGAGLAGGSWHTIESLINKHWVANGIDVTVYDLETPQDLSQKIAERKA